MSDDRSRADEGRRMSTADFASSGRPEHRGGDELSRPPERTGPAPLLPEAEVGELRSRWDGIQAGFVDEPRRAVEEADSLVAMAMKRIAETFASERSGLEQQWDRGDDVSTEDLRVALQRYRLFRKAAVDLSCPEANRPYGTSVDTLAASSAFRNGLVKRGHSNSTPSTSA